MHDAVPLVQLLDLKLPLGAAIEGVLTALDIDVHAHSEQGRFSVRTSRASDESWHVHESPIAPAPGKRATSLGPTEMYLLSQWGRQIAEGLEEMAYLVGSCARGEPWRDIDVRVMVDEPHPFLIPGRLQVINVAFTVWGQRVTGLPIDFQIQPTAEANALYGGQRRNALFVSSED